MNKLIGNIKEIEMINFDSIIFESNESSFTSRVWYNLFDKEVHANYFYKIKNKKKFIDVFQITNHQSLMYIDRRSYDTKNLCAHSPIIRESLLKNRRNYFWFLVENPLVFIEAFPFLEKEVLEWIVMFAENREISKKDIIGSLSSFFEKKK